jgi:hypothetical protein
MDRSAGRDGSSQAAEVTALRDAERRLQRAQLASDVSALDQLIDDRLVFTGPDGKLYTKQDDLDVHRSGQQAMSRVDEEDLAVLVVGSTGLTWFLGTLDGAIAGEPFRSGFATPAPGFAAARDGNWSRHTSAARTPTPRLRDHGPLREQTPPAVHAVDVLEPPAPRGVAHAKRAHGSR